MESRDRDKPTLYSPGGFAPIPTPDSGTDNFIGFTVDFVTARNRGKHIEDIFAYTIYPGHLKNLVNCLFPVGGLFTQ
jgi:hypothetical protein